MALLELTGWLLPHLPAATDLQLSHAALSLVRLGGQPQAAFVRALDAELGARAAARTLTWRSVGNLVEALRVLSDAPPSADGLAAAAAWMQAAAAGKGGPQLDAPVALALLMTWVKLAVARPDGAAARTLPAVVAAADWALQADGGPPGRALLVVQRAVSAAFGAAATLEGVTDVCVATGNYFNAHNCIAGLRSLGRRRAPPARLYWRTSVNSSIQAECVRTTQSASTQVVG